MEGVRLYKCPKCMDKGYILTEKPHPMIKDRVVPVMYARPCGYCDKGEHAATGNWKPGIHRWDTPEGETGE